MKYATLILGLALVLTSIAAARAAQDCRPATLVFDCKSIEITLTYRANSPNCQPSGHGRRAADLSG
jgi:hypothetical protein